MKRLLATLAAGLVAACFASVAFAETTTTTTEPSTTTTTTTTVEPK
ncbi:hypothetical protein [Geomonas silvestris]|nr:hypothetical protein [Geomonas silvestris]